MKIRALHHTFVKQWELQLGKSFLSSNICVNELIIHPHIKEDQTKPVCFIKKNQFDQEKFEKFEI